MKLSKYLWLLFVVSLYVSNFYWFKMNIWPFTGIVLGLLISLVIVINIVIKIKNRRGKTDDNFIFSEKTANIIRNVDIATQYEASILSVFCLIIGIVLFMVYVIFLAPYHWLMKIFVCFNSVCGIVLMGSMLVTSYQQFMSYRESKKVMEQFANQYGTEVVGPDKLKPGKIMTPLKKGAEK